MARPFGCIRKLARRNQMGGQCAQVWAHWLQPIPRTLISGENHSCSYVPALEQSDGGNGRVSLSRLAKIVEFSRNQYVTTF